MAEVIGVSELYKHYGILADAADKNQHAESYKIILQATQGDSKEKLLSASFIPKFFKHFPDLAEEAFDKQIDLIEDEESNVRKAAVKHFPELCKDDSQYCKRVADILTQFLVTDIDAEVTLCRRSMITLLVADPTGVLEVIFSHIKSNAQIQGKGLNCMRRCAIACLKVAVNELKGTLFNSNEDNERFLAEQIKNALGNDVTEEEFADLMKILKSLKYTTKNPQVAVDAIMQQIEPKDSNSVGRILSCLKSTIPFIQKAGSSSAQLMTYVTRNVLPVLNSIDGEGERLSILKCYAEISNGCHDTTVAEACAPLLYPILIQYLPEPPDNSQEAKEESNDTEPNYQFSYVECLLYTFHRLCSESQTFISEDGDKFKDFKKRLQYFTLCCQNYTKRLRSFLQERTAAALKLEKNQIKLQAIKTMTNITNLVKDFFRNPLSFKTQVTLSWQSTVSNNQEYVSLADSASTALPNESKGQRKRITFDAAPVPAKKANTTAKQGGNKPNRQPYRPPYRRSNWS
ncbi:Apoptosis inhibitor 5 [Trichoplax sp. H2]|nr:Apoptosis inhibitor 5 [Trichoplax sp. H2]|eukprot:RDD38966.1 Apoptosis inhibitor 5 [Trichoplax sp. H2]